MLGVHCNCTCFLCSGSRHVSEIIGEVILGLYNFDWSQDCIRGYIGLPFLNHSLSK